MAASVYDFKNPKVRNKDIWCGISQAKLPEGHTTCDPKSCEMKLNNLKRSYTKCTDHNKKTGDAAKKCAYYEELHKIFHDDANITQPAVYSGRRGLLKRNEQQTSAC